MIAIDTSHARIAPGAGVSDSDGMRAEYSAPVANCPQYFAE